MDDSPRSMTYMILTPIAWRPFDPPVASTDTPLEGVPLAQMVVSPGLVQGDGLKQLLGGKLFNDAVELGMVEPIP